MPAPPTVQAALQSLKETASKSKKKLKNRIIGDIDQLSSHFVLLGLSEISSQSSRKLASCLRQPLVPIYEAFPSPALQLCASIFYQIYHEKILSAIGNQLQEQKGLWEAALNSLLSGVLDFLDDHENHGPTKEAIASMLYPVLCDICFSLTAPMMSVELRCTAYTLLSEAAANNATNQHKLRDSATLGGERLGALIWRTKDFLALESVLGLFARILPTTQQSGGRAKRTAFIKSVFEVTPPPELVSVGKQVAEILENIPKSDWEETCVKVVDTLASANIAFPQSFALDRVVACGTSKATDRLYVDDKALVANIFIGNDQCDSMTVLFSVFRRIEVVRRQSGQKEEGTGNTIQVVLMSPPVVGKDPVSHDGKGDPSLSFVVKNTDLERLTRVLQSRGQKLLFADNVYSKLSLPKSPAMLEFGIHGKSLKELSQDERIENVSLFYETHRSSDSFPGSDQGDANILRGVPDHASQGPITSTKGNKNSSVQTPAEPSTLVPCDGEEAKTKVTTTARLSPRDPISDSSSRKPAVSQSTAALHSGSARPSTAASLARSYTQITREAVFGASDEELSDISDADGFSGPSQQSKPQSLSKSSSILMSRRSSTVRPLELVKVSTRSAPKRTIDSDDEETAPATRTDRRRKGMAAIGKKAAVHTLELLDDQPHYKATGNMVVTPLRERADTIPVPTKTNSATVLDAVLEPTLDAVAATSANLSSVTKPNSNQTRSVVSAISAIVSSSKSMPPASDAPDTAPDTAPDVPVAFVNDSSPVVAINGVTVPTRLKQATPSHHTPCNSSPIPVVQVDRMPIKSRMRKKDQHISHTVPCVEPSSKRKRNLDDEPPRGDCSTPDTGNRLAKKARKTDVPVSEPPSAIPPERTESQVLRPRNTAATRATRRYRAKKDRTSSPIASATDVNYDTLPSPPDSSARTPSSPTTVQHTVKTVSETSRATESSSIARRTRASTASLEKENKSAASASRTLKTAEPKTKLESTSKKNQKAAEKVRRKAVEIPPKPEPPANATAVKRASAHARATAGHTEEVLQDERGESTQSDEVAPMRPRPRNNKKSNNPPWADANFAPSVQEASGSLNFAQEILEDSSYNPDGGDLNQSDGACDDTLIEEVTGNERGDFKAIPQLNEVPESLAQVEKSVPQSLKNEIQDIAAESTATFRSEHARPLKINLVAQKPELCLPSSPVPRPKKQSITIDLTSEDSPVKSETQSRKASSLTPSCAFELEGVALSASPTPSARGTTRISASPPSVKSPRLRHSVTFAPVVKERQLSPLVSHDAIRVLAIKETPVKLRTSSVSPNSILKKSLQQRKLDNATDNDDDDEHVFIRSDFKKKPADIGTIASVLQEISRTIMRNIERRFDGVREEVRIGRDALLAEAASDLFQLRAESVGHFNRLIDLEAEYATFTRSIIAGLEDATRLNQEICSNLGRTIEGHDRSTLSKKMPTTLFPVLVSRQ